MKKTLSLFVMLIACMTMMAETVRIDFTKAPDEQSPNKVVWKVGDLTFTVDKGKSTHNVNEKVDQNGIVLNKEQVMTISSTNGTTIQKATFKDSPVEPGPTPPTFSVLQNCTAEYGWDTVLTAETDDCTSMGGTLSAYSHIIWVDIETGGTSTGGGDNPSGVDSKALRTLYVDFLNYRSTVEVYHLTAFYLFLAVEQHVDQVSQHFENQQECDDLYAWLMEKFNIIREMAGDTPYNQSEYAPRGFQTNDLDQLLHNAEKYYSNIVNSHANQAAILNNALNEAKANIADITTQANVETIYNALLEVFNNVKDACENSGDNDDNDKYGTPMEPIKPDLNQYTHKMMVLGAPWGMEDLCMAILRDNEGRVVQKMTMRIDAGELSAHITDSVRTYNYEGNKMIEYLAVPSYDENDVLHMEPMNRTTTSYYKLANGHREVVEQAWFEDGEYVGGRSREEYIFDEEGRKVNYKKYFGTELDSDITYTYDENGGCLGRGLYEGYDKYVGYTRYDTNGNLRGRTEWGTYYEYFYDNQNHYQGYKYYDGYNFDDNTYRSVNDNNYFEIVETYADGSAKKMKRKGDGQVRTFSREGNVETQKNTGNGTEVVITRTFDDQGRIVAKTSTEKDFKASYIYSDLAANQVLGAVNTFDEDLHTNYQEQTNWTYSNPLMATTFDYTFWGFNEKAFTTYNIVPLSVLPAQTTEEGVAISLGGEGDQVVLSNDGEIYLLDKGGKKRYSVSVAGITVSSEGGKIVVTGWTPVSPEASAKGMHKAPETIDLSTNEYDIYIPEDVITINGKPLNEVYLPITLDDSEANGIVEVKYDNRNTTTDGRIYNLQGVQVKNPVHGQIVIINGKKVLTRQ